MGGGLREETVVEVGPGGSKSKSESEEPEEDTKTSEVFVGHRLMIA